MVSFLHQVGADMGWGEGWGGKNSIIIHCALQKKVKGVHGWRGGGGLPGGRRLRSNILTGSRQ